MNKVAALYIDPRGPYPKLLGADMCWDEARDARLYEGPWPVVAHPPCGPWGRLRRFSEQDPSCGPRAFEQVRRFGGVLEHPSESTLFAYMQAPRPGDEDDWGGRTYQVDQVAWGHACQKRTWLYVVGVSPADFASGVRFGGEPTHRIKTDVRHRKLTGVRPAKTSAGRITSGAIGDSDRLRRVPDTARPTRAAVGAEGGLNVESLRAKED